MPVSLKISQIADVKGGKRLPKGEELLSVVTDHPYIRAQDIRDGKITIEDRKYLSSEQYKRLKRYTVSTEDVCIVIVGANVGDVGIVPPELHGANLTENAVKLTNFRSGWVPRYINYCLSAETCQAQMQQIAGGAAQPKLGIYKVLDVEVPVASPSAQSRIVSILSAYDDLIENNTRRMKTLEEMARLFYNEWFVKLRFPGYEKVKMVESELGPIPEGWGVGQFSDLGGLARESISPGRFEDEVFAHYSFEAFDAGCIPLLHEGKTIKSNKYIVVPNCVLLSKLNPRIPRVWMPYPRGSKRAIASTEFLVIVPKKPFTREFLYCSCRSDGFLRGLVGRALGTSSSHQRVKPEELMGLPFVTPSEIVVEKFTYLITSVLEQIEALRLKNANLRHTRDLLLPRLISGELDVENLDIAIPDPARNGETAAVVPATI